MTGRGTGRGSLRGYLGGAAGGRVMGVFKARAPIRTLLYRQGNWCPWRGSVRLKAVEAHRCTGLPRSPQRAGALYGRVAGCARRKHLADCACLSVCPRFCMSVPTQLERARSEAGEALSALRRLQRRVSDLEEESRLQDADLSGASLQSELAHSLDGDQHQNQHQNKDGHRDALVSSRPSSPNVCHTGGLQTPLLFLFPRDSTPH